jgi:TolA-binding protein
MNKGPTKLSILCRGLAVLIYGNLLIGIPVLAQDKEDASQFQKNEVLKEKITSNQRKTTAVIQRYFEILKSKGSSASTKQRILLELFELRIKPQQGRILEFPLTELTALNPQAKPIPIEIKMDLEIIDRYLALYPQDPQASGLKLLKGRILWNQNQFGRAIEVMHQLIESYTNAPESKQAMDLVLEYHRIRKKYDRLCEAAGAFLKHPLAQRDQQYQTVLLTALRNGLWEWAQALKAEEKPQASNIFLKFQHLFPDDQLADQALAQVVDLNIARGNGSGATSAGTKLFTSYPLSVYRRSILLKVADVFVQQTQFENAGEVYRLYAKEYPKDSGSPDLLLKAKQFYDYTENHDGSNLISQEFLSLYPDHPQAINVELAIAEGLEEAQDFEKSLIIFKNISDRYRESNQEEAMYAQIKHALILLNNVNSSQGRALLTSVEPSVMNSPKLYRAKEALAKQKMKENRQQMRNVLDIANLQQETYPEFDRTHADLLKKVSEIQKVYLQLIEIGDLTTKGEGFLELGNLYEKLSKKYSKGLKNPKFTQKEREKYNAQREEVLNLCRQQMVASWNEGYRLTKVSSETRDIQRKISLKLSRMERGLVKDFSEESLEAGYISQHLSKGDLE